MILISSAIAGSPVNLLVEDYDRSSASLKWQKPLKDGGSSIIGYFVEYQLQEGDKKWIRVTEKPIEQCHNKILELVENKDYKYVWDCKFHHKIVYIIHRW